MPKIGHVASQGNHILSRGIAVLTVVAILMALAVAPAFAGGKDRQAGNSHVHHCAISEPDGSYAGDGYANVTFKVVESGYWFVVTAHGLEPGTEYELRSGGAFEPRIGATANGGGNALFKGTTDSLGQRFNIWDVSNGDTRILRTNPETCVIP